MKNRIRLLLLLLVMTICLAGFGAVAYADDMVYTEGTLHYTISNDSVTIVNYFGKDAEVWVPAMIAGYPVNTIASGAFTENEYVQTLYLPDTITTIESGAIGEGIYVVYNANTDHPQDTPTDLILGRLEPVPPMTQETTGNEAPAEPEPSIQTGSGTSDLDEPQATSQTQISEEEIDLEEEEGENATASPSTEAAEETTGSAEAEADGTQADGADPAGDSANREKSGTGTVLAAVVGVLAVLTGVGVLASRKKKKAQD